MAPFVVPRGKAGLPKSSKRKEKPQPQTAATATSTGAIFLVRPTETLNLKPRTGSRRVKVDEPQRKGYGGKKVVRDPAPIVVVDKKHYGSLPAGLHYAPVANKLPTGEVVIGRKAVEDKGPQRASAADKKRFLGAPLGPGVRRNIAATATSTERWLARHPGYHGPPPEHLNIFQRWSRRDRALGDAIPKVLSAAATGTGHLIGQGAETVGRAVLGEVTGLARGPSQKPLGAPGSDIMKVQEAGISPMVPLNQLGAVGMGATKALVGGAGALYALRHPEKGLPALLSDGLKMLEGAALAPGLVVAMSDPSISAAKKEQMVTEGFQMFLKDLKDKYGEDATYSEVFGDAQKEPATYLLNALAVASPLAKAPLVAKALAEGASFGEAVRLANVPAKARMLYYGAGAEKKAVEIARARSPITRWTMNAPYDALSHLADRYALTRRLSISETRRAARAAYKNMNRNVRRMPAEAQAAFRDVVNLLREDENAGTALAILLQKPKGMTDDEFLRAALRNMQDMLTSGEFHIPQVETATAQRLLNRIDRLDKATARLQDIRRTRAIKNVAAEQDRLHGVIEEIGASRAAVKKEMRQLADDPNEAPREKRLYMNDHEVELRMLDRQAAEAHAQLGRISGIDHAPISGPARDQARGVLEKIPHFQENPQRIDQALALTDTLAQRYATRYGIEPDEWYARNLNEFVRDPGKLSSEAGLFYQERGVVAPQRFTAAEHGGEILDRYTPVKQRGEPRPKIAGLPKIIKTRAQFGRLIEDMAGRLEAGLDFAKNWYRDSGREILAAVGGDEDRADKVAQLVAIYSPQKPVAPNIAVALRVLQDWEDGVARGLPGAVKVGSAHQRRLARMALKGEDWLASVKPNQLPKVRRFYANILKHVAPERLADHGFNGREVTVDGWMGAAFGYGYNTGNSGLTEAQFRLVEDVVQRLADHYGIDPEEAQAAIWTSIKAERDRSTAAMYANPETRLQALEKAGQSFADAMFTPKNTLRLPLESMTADKPFLQDLTPGQLAAHTSEYGNATLRVLHDEGFVVRHDAGGFGFWRDPATGEIERNPATAVEVALGDRPVTRMRGKEVAQQAARGLYLSVPQSVRELAQGLSAALGDAAKQHQAAWARYLNPRGQASDVTAWRIELGRPLADAESEALNDALHGDFHFTPSEDGGIIAFNTPDAVLDRSVRVENMGQRGLKAEARQERRALTNLANERRAHVDNAIGAVWPGDDEITLTELAHRGGLLDRGDYQEAISAGRRSDLYQRVRDRLSGAYEEIDGHFIADPVAAAARAEQHPGSLSLGTAGGDVARLDQLNQARRGDILGAVRFLSGTDEGKRIVYLTSKADFSTWVHEMVGHAAREMKQMEPGEFAAVEHLRGKALEDWNVTDHEWFASQVERWFYAGKAPTPELVPVFERVRTYMRTIYAAVKSIIKEPIPAEMKRLLDTYFGGYDDVNVDRIAGFMPRETAREQRVSHGAAAAREELAAYRSRQAKLKHARSIEGMQERLTAIRDKGDDATQEELDEATQMTATLLARVAEREMRRDTREKALTQKISEVKNALDKGVDHPQFQNALNAMRWIADDRERILREVFGDRYDETFRNRKDLLADFLVERGLLRANFVRGSAHYFPATLDEPYDVRVKQPAAPLTSNVIGQTKASQLVLHKRNQMILWQRGDWTADPQVLLDAHARAQAYAWSNEVKKTLFELGRPITLEEYENPRLLKGQGYLVNPRGTPVGTDMRAAINNKTVTHNVQKFHDGGEGGDPSALEASLVNYWRNFLGDADAQLPEGFLMSDVRVVPREIVESMLRPLSGTSTKFGRRWDYATTAARWATMYANVPGYMIANGVGSIGFLLAQYGWRADRIVRDAKTLLGNEKLYHRVLAEIGELPYQAMRKTGYGLNARFTDAEQAALHFVGTADRWPRAVSWVHEARKAGYNTEEDMLRLVAGKTAKTQRDRDLVAQSTANFMVDFERLTAFERQVVTRVFFVWPWIRGATAWPFWFAKNQPVKAALGAAWGRAQYQRAEDILGPRPPWYAAMYPIEKLPGGQARVANVGPISLTGTAASSVRMIRDLVLSMVGMKDKATASHLSDLFQPLLGDALTMATNRDPFGNPTTLRDALQGAVFSAIPGARLIRSTMSDDATPNVFTFTGLEHRLMHTFLRIEPENIMLARLNKQAYDGGAALAPADQIRDTITEIGKKYQALYDEPLPPEVKAGIRLKIHYEAASKVLIDKIKGDRKHYAPSRVSPGGAWRQQPSLSEPRYRYQDVLLKYTILKQDLPGADIESPDAYLRENNATPDTVWGQQVMNAWERQWSAYADLPSTVESEYKQTKLGQKMERQETGKK
ncbi:MAG TPA: hypothetical protein VLI07_18615 [Candidatus Binatus sp.]|nr:hypothetical protein [Candidatus Binatus sp.]